MEFKLDTSGRVTCDGRRCICHARTWDQLSPFQRGYISELFTSEAQQLSDQNPNPRYLDTPEGYTAPGFADLSGDSLAYLLDDCATFQGRAGRMIPPDLAEQAGAVFWRSRNGLGDGFANTWPGPVGVDLDRLATGEAFGVVGLVELDEAGKVIVQEFGHDVEPEAEGYAPRPPVEPEPCARSLLAAVVAEWESGRTGWRDDLSARLDGLSDPIEAATAWLKKTDASS